MGSVAIAENEGDGEHRSPGHPERPDRVAAIRAHLGAEPAFAELRRLRIQPVDNEALLRVHTAEHLAAVAALSAAGGGHFDVDSYATSASDNIARAAAGGAVAAVHAVVAGEADASFAVVRPPGHHATADRAMGFCLYNNVAVAIEHARSDLGIRRIAVVDIDVHHGNGTEAMYWNEPDLLYTSLHQWPLYPGTGAVTDRGGPGASGATVNVPLPAGTDSAGWLAAFDGVIMPALEAFGSELVIVSCGFDAHRDDPLAQLGVATDAYGAVAERLTGLDSPAEGRSVWVLEGGYDLDALVASTDAVLRVLVGA